MKYCKALLAAALISQVDGKRQFVQESHEKLSSTLQHTQAFGGKNDYMIGRSLNKRSSAQNKSVFSYFTDYVFGESDTRTDFDRRMEAYVAN